MAKNYSTEIADAVLAVINNNGWKVKQYDQENGLIQMRFTLKCALDHANIIIDLRDDFYLVLACIDMSVPESYRKETAKYLTLANYGLYLGYFEMDMGDGELRYKCPVDCDHFMPSNAIIKKSIVIPVLMFNRFGEGLTKVMLGMESAEKARAEADSE